MKYREKKLARSAYMNLCLWFLWTNLIIRLADTCVGYSSLLRLYGNNSQFKTCDEGRMTATKLLKSR